MKAFICAFIKVDSKKAIFLKFRDGGPELNIWRMFLHNEFNTGTERGENILLA